MSFAKTCCGFYCAMTAAVGVYFFFILGIMEFKGNTYLTNVLQYVPCVDWDDISNSCKGDAPE